MSSLLAPDEPPAVTLERPQAGSPFVFTCDHAGRRIPRALGSLGLPEAELERHIAWDIGALGVARGLAERLDGVLVAQHYSRLVIDCNRPLDSTELITTRSEATDIPGNRNLAPSARAARIATFYAPYHAAISTLLDARAGTGRDSVFVAVHSFTPVYLGRARPWQVGVLYGTDSRLAQAVLAALRAERELTVGDNQPYRIDDKDQGIPQHALARGLPNVLFEIRQDLIASAVAQAAWSARLATVLTAACAALAAA